MSASADSASPEPPAPAQAPERETSSVESRWDLVFVLAIRQVTALLRSSPPEAAARVVDPGHGLR